MTFERVTQRVHPGLQVVDEKLALLREVGHGHVVARNQVSHDLAEVGDVVLGFGQALVARQAQGRQVVTQLGQGFLVQETAEVVGAEKVDLGFAHTAEERVVFAGDGRQVQLARRTHQATPGLLQETACSRGLGGRQAQLIQQLGTGRRVIQGGQQAIDLGTRGLFVQAALDELGVVGFRW